MYSIRLGIRLSIKLIIQSESSYFNKSISKPPKRKILLDVSWGIANPSLVILNCFIWGIILLNSNDLLLSQSSHFRFFHRLFFTKELFNVCHANCSQIVPRLATYSKFLGARTILNQMNFDKNLVFGMFYSISIKLCPWFSKKVSVLVFLKKPLSTMFCQELLQKYA